MSGKGAEKYCDRLNSRGTPLIYIGTSRAICVAGLLVHLPIHLLPGRLTITTFELIGTLPTLKANDFPYNTSTQPIGDQLFKNNELGVFVPSAVVKSDLNCILNPFFKDFSKRLGVGCKTFYS